MQHYWIGDFFIDLSRNQITHHNTSQTLAPKALAVLTYLAEQQGKVVSQDELLDNVWAGTVVSPNTLQRSIAQLRKALGDDGKTQVLIKTHAKKGYSLECEVCTEKVAEEPTTQVLPVDAASVDAAPVDAASVDAAPVDTAPVDTASMADGHEPVLKTAKVPVKLGAMIITLCAMFMAGFHYFSSSKPVHISVSEIRALTATDYKESGGIYSPDGQFIVFSRYSDALCINHIWAKNIETQEEFQLTKNLRVYGAHSFSSDGNKLTFITQDQCDKPITQKMCYQLVSLDFTQALSAPQSPTVLMECKNSEIRKPMWLNNNDIALLQKRSDAWKLIRYSVSQGESTPLYHLPDGSINDFDVSNDGKKIALTGFHSDGHYYIEMLTPKGEVLSSHRIEYPNSVAPHRLIYPNFSPMADQLIFSTGRRLFTVTQQGKVAEISLPLDQPIGVPVVHPQGQKMLAIKGHYDSDVVIGALDDVANMVTQTEQGAQADAYTVLHRSNVAEDSATFSPDSQLIAYISERSGDPQVWLTDGNKTRQLSSFAMDSEVFGLKWANHGGSLLVNVNRSLTRIRLDAQGDTYTFDYPIERLFQWDSVSNTALAQISINGIVKLALLNLDQLSVHVLLDSQVVWADRSADGQVVYMDKMHRFWRLASLEAQHLDALQAQGSRKRFVINNGALYGINEALQLWSYQLDTGEFTIIGAAPSNVDYLTDVNATHVLMDIKLSSKKEVVELILGG
ncbi:winged helix-turn-helix domain-containing protein [Pseudoalteromonas sp. T1lg23B]|uniref:winged helix-turn-helix domain-containing protein n=1 Tax=Pseudoalteromonas sp. T1lg23B TaxID=2077097 RepID=UPI000CF69841|nr:transcriptional regulator [Pseudoalteromonas sp. T1lg23B]